MKILLVSNYLGDRQESMQRFTDILAQGLLAAGHQVRVIRPYPVMNKLFSTANFSHKWLGYLDKYLFFPSQLKQAAAWADVVHICDHSNAMYGDTLRAVPYLITCHDLGAVRGALGEIIQTDCPASWTGKLLQRWIFHSLQQAHLIACVSQATQQDVENLTQTAIHQKVRLVVNGLNYPYCVVSELEAARRLAQIPRLNQPFVLHVGSSLSRKNRDGILRIFKQVSHHWSGQLVFAGEQLTPELVHLAKQLEIEHRIVQITKPDNDLLEALYNQAFALLFPSRFEGFGWPVIEAQACGCPVLCSNRNALPEVVGDSAIVRAVEDEVGFATAILQLTEPTQRKQWIGRGFDNIQRFTTENMIASYLKLYAELTGVS